MVTSNLNLAHLNIRSASSITDSCNKPLLLQEFILENSIDVLSVTKIWLSPDTPPSVLNSLTPPNFCILYHPRPKGRGGGIAPIYRSFLRASKISIPACSSFEAFCVRISFSNFSCSILSVYRHPALSKLTSFLNLLPYLKFLFLRPPNLSSPVTSTTILTVHLINLSHNFFLALTCLI